LVFVVFIVLLTKNGLVNEASRLIRQRHDPYTVSLTSPLCLLVSPADSWSAQTTGETALERNPGRLCADRRGMQQQNEVIFALAKHDDIS
jgi:hypothetical protein